jgi:hypothetical protein
MRTIQYWLIFPKFHLCAAVRTQNIENIFRLPILLILTRAAWYGHDLPPVKRYDYAAYY